MWETEKTILEICWLENDTDLQTKQNVKKGISTTCLILEYIETDGIADYAIK